MWQKKALRQLPDASACSLPLRVKAGSTTPNGPWCGNTLPSDSPWRMICSSTISPRLADDTWSEIENVTLFYLRACLIYFLRGQAPQGVCPSLPFLCSMKTFLDIFSTYEQKQVKNHCKGQIKVGRSSWKLVKPKCCDQSHSSE